MFFDKLSSVYEIYIASNLASMVSQRFNDAIEHKILMAYDKVKGVNDKVRSKVEISRDSLSSLVSSENVKIEIRDDVSRKFSELNDKYNAIDVKILEKKYTQSISDFIPAISLFCTIYTFTVLIIGGFLSDTNLSIECWNSFALVNFICMFFLIKVTHSERVLIYHHVVYWIAGIYLFGFLYFYFLSEYLQFIHIGSKFPAYFTVITSLIIPIYHYAVFITKAMIISKKESFKLENELSNFEKDFDIFYKTEVEEKLIAVKYKDMFV